MAVLREDKPEGFDLFSVDNEPLARISTPAYPFNNEMKRAGYLLLEVYQHQVF
jgi:hypothetical protein